MGARCNQCGNCCERIPLNTTKTIMRKQDLKTDKGKENRAFILAHWKRVGRRGKQQVYSCDAFDPVTRQCTAHDERPPICREYPWYGRTPNKEQLMAEPEKLGSCSYWFDIPKKEWPEGIAPYRLGGTPVAIRTRIACGLSYREVAKEMECSVSTAYDMVQRAIADIPREDTESKVG